MRKVIRKINKYLKEKKSKQRKYMKVDLLIKILKHGPFIRF